MFRFTVVSLCLLVSVHGQVNRVVLILDGYSEIGALVLSEIDNLILLRLLLRLTDSCRRFGIIFKNDHVLCTYHFSSFFYFSFIVSVYIYIIQIRVAFRGSEPDPGCFLRKRIHFFLFSNQGPFFHGQIRIRFFSRV